MEVLMIIGIILAVALIVLVLIQPRQSQLFSMDATSNIGKKDKNDNSDTATSNASSTQGTYGSSADAKKYANDEIARLVKENKKHYSYTVDRNNKGEFVVNIKEG